MATLLRIHVILSFFTAICAWEAHRNAKILTGNDEIGGGYDYVIAGGGTAGLTVADRLSADGKSQMDSVLVIEYGVLDNSSAVLTGGLLAGRDPSREFSFQSAPQTGLNNRSIEVVVGKMVGGSSGINGLQALRGTREEYNIWAQLGGRSSTWGWKGLMPYFRRAMHFVPPLDYLSRDFNITWDMDAWGQDIDTRVFAGYPNYLNPSMKFLFKGMSTMPGVSIPKDGNFGTTGVYFWPNTMDPSTYSRSYARTGHWDGIDRPNYSLLVGSKVVKVEFDGNCATGVSVVSSIDGVSWKLRIKARKEVILAAGTVHTPQILELSGIGPDAILSAAGIPVKVNLPGVGENFQDHALFYGLGYKWGIQPPTPIVNGSGNPNTTLSMNCGAVIGLPAITSQEKAAALIRDFNAQDAGDHLPKDVHPHVLAGYKAQKNAFSRIFQNKNTAWMWLILGAPLSLNPVNQHPISRGNVHINASNPHGPPVVDYRSLSNPLDLAIMIEMLRFIRKYASNDLFTPYKLTEGSPGVNVTDSAELGEWVRNLGYHELRIKARYTPSAYHPVGTAAKMPRELGGVVDEELRVYGVEGLRVVDASIMPIIPGAPTVLTTYAIAEKAADLIRKRA